jgi:hypothetical protein
VKLAAGPCPWSPPESAFTGVPVPVSLIANRAVVEAAGEVDAVFWRHSDRIDRGELTDEAAWFAATERMEAVRLAFVNTAKRHVLGSADRLDRLPIRRPRGDTPGVSSTPPSPSDRP